MSLSICCVFSPWINMLFLWKKHKPYFFKIFLYPKSSSYKPTMRIIYPQPNLWLLVLCASMSSLQMVSAIALNFQPCSTNQEKPPCGHIGCKCLFNKAMVKFDYFKYILASVSQKYGKPFQRQQIELRIGFVSVLIDPSTLVLQISSIWVCRFLWRDFSSRVHFVFSSFQKVQLGLLLVWNPGNILFFCPGVGIRNPSHFLLPPFGALIPSSIWSPELGISQVL